MHLIVPYSKVGAYGDKALPSFGLNFSAKSAWIMLATSNGSPRCQVVAHFTQIPLGSNMVVIPYLLSGSYAGFT